MKRWLDEPVLEQSRAQMKEIILRKRIAHKVKRPPSPPPTARLLDASAWELEVQRHIDDIDDRQWWFKNVRRTPPPPPRPFPPLPFPRTHCH